MQIKKYLQKAYPYYYQNLKRLFVLLLLISVSSFLFSYLFEPFEVNTNEHKMDHIWILLLHAFLPLPIAFFYFLCLNKMVENESLWTLGKEIFHVSMILILIGIASFLIRDLIYTNPDNWSFRYFWEEIRNTFLIGFLLITILLPLNRERLFKKYNESSKKLQLDSIEVTQNEEEITIKTALESEQFSFKISDFIFAKVEGNYIEIYTKTVNENGKKLVRLTLKELEAQLKTFNNIFKTHRSYLVNINFIESVSGNAQGYSIILKNTYEVIPVSRSKITEFNTLFSTI